MNINIIKRFALIPLCLALFACGGGGNDENEENNDLATDRTINDAVEVANAFGSQVVFNAGTFQAGPPPVPDATLNTNEVDGGIVTPGEQTAITPNFGNVTNGLNLNANVTVNIAFSGGNANLASGFTAIQTTVADINNGSFNGSFSVPADMCANLSDIQHQIRCYESVTLPDGTVVSTSQARNMVLACDGSTNGNICVQQCGANETCVAGVCVGQGALRFSLTWNDNADLDLYVLTPAGSEIYYGDRSADGGELDVDNTLGGQGSVENVFFSTALDSGTYTYYVDNFSNVAASWQLQVARNGTVLATQSGTFSGGSQEEQSAHFLFTF